MNNEQQSSGQLKLYYCMSCGFARVFHTAYSDFDDCPVCGAKSYIESSLNKNLPEEPETTEQIDEDHALQTKA